MSRAVAGRRAVVHVQSGGGDDRENAGSDLAGVAGRGDAGRENGGAGGGGGLSHAEIGRRARQGARTVARVVGGACRMQRSPGEAGRENGGAGGGGGLSDAEIAGRTE